MGISATQEGRNLHIHVDGLEPFIIKPLPGGAGAQITETYLKTATGDGDQSKTAAALAIAVDGAAFDSESDEWVLAEVRPNSARMESTLSLAETEDVAMVAFFWQTLLGIDGVNTYLDGKGVQGHTKAMWALVQRMGLSPLLTSPSSALDDLIRLQGSSPSTYTPQGGAKPGKQPADRQMKKAHRRAR